MRHPAPQTHARRDPHTGRTLPRRAFLSLPLAAAAVGAAGCGFDDSSTPEPQGSGPSGSQSNSGAGGKGLTTTFREAYRPANHLNPGLGGGGSPQSTLLMAMMREGLLRRDPTNSQKYLPGAAESWEVSDDGKTTTLHLRDGLKWSNGAPITADDFVWAFSYYYSPDVTKGSKYPAAHKGDPDHTSITGMSDYNAGKTKDFSTVGVKAKDDKTIEVMLTGPDYTFLDSLVRIYPLQKKNVEAHPKDFWSAENFVGNGPYKMTAYKQNSAATMEKNEHYWDADSFGITTRDIQFNSSGSTGMMVSYNADEIDLFRVDGDPTALIAGRKELQSQLQHGSFLQFKGLMVYPSSNPVLQKSQKARQALAFALDRDALAKVSPPDVAGPSWVPSGIEGADQIPKAEFDPDKAKQLLADAGYPDGKGFPDLTIFTYAKMPVLEAVGQMWTKHLNIKTQVAVKEVGLYGDMMNGNLPENKVFLAFNYQAPSPYTMLRYGSPTYFNKSYVNYDAIHQYFDLTRGKDKNKYTGAKLQQVLTDLLEKNWLPEYKEFHQLAAQADQAQADMDKATQLATQAAKSFQESYLFIPLLWAGYTFMVKPRIQDLTLTSYADDMFTLKGVTLDPVTS